MTLSEAKRPVPLSPSGRAEAELREREARTREQHLLDKLYEVGYALKRLPDILDYSGDKQAAVDLLVAEFPNATDRRLKVTVARICALPEARRHWPSLVKFFKQEEEPEGKKSLVKEALSGTLAELADDIVLDDVVSLARDEAQGITRMLLFPFLAGTGNSKGVETLTWIASHDPQLAHQAKVCLRARRRHKQL